MGVHFSRHYQLPMLVMEYLPLSLTQCLKSHRDLPLQIKYSILLDVAKGLNYLHCKRPPIVHRDLTANNILLTSNFVAKISDLGVSRMADTFNCQELSIAPGNSVVMPPEALKDNPVYDHKLDVFSYGCLILHVFTHEWPKPSEKYVPSTDFFQKGTFIHVNEWERRVRYTSIISNDNPFYLFAKSCLKNDPKKRPTMSDAITCAQGAVSSLHPLKNQFDMMKENNALRKHVDQLVKQVRDIHVLEKVNKAQTNAYILEEVMEQTQSYTQRLEQEKKKAQDNVNRLQQEKKEAQKDARVSKERMEEALQYAHRLQQEKKEAQKDARVSKERMEEALQYAHRLQQEKKEAQKDARVSKERMEEALQYAHRLQQEKKEAQKDARVSKERMEEALQYAHRLQQEKKEAQKDARVSKERMEEALQYAHRLQQEKDKIQSNTCPLEDIIEQTQRDTRLEQEKKIAQNYVNQIAHKSNEEKNHLVGLLSKVKREKTSLLRQVVHLEERLNHAQTKLKLSFLAIIIVLILQYCFLRLL